MIYGPFGAEVRIRDIERDSPTNPLLGVVMLNGKGGGMILRYRFELRADGGMAEIDTAIAAVRGREERIQAARAAFARVEDGGGEFKERGGNATQGGKQ